MNTVIIVNNREEQKSMKKNDFILIATLLICSIIAFFAVNSTQTRQGGKVVIKIDGQIYRTLDFSATTHEEIIIENNGHRNVLLIDNGRVDMIEANCPDKTCVRQKPIQYENQTIVCLPSKLVIEIEAQIGIEESEIDIIQ